MVITVLTHNVHGDLHLGLFDRSDQWLGSLPGVIGERAFSAVATSLPRDRAEFEAETHRSQVRNFRTISRQDSWTMLDTIPPIGFRGNGTQSYVRRDG